MRTKADIRAEVAAHLFMWNVLGSEIAPIDQEIVAGMPFDDHVSVFEQERLIRLLHRHPGSASGHYGKELNLMLAGHKRVALIDDTDVGAWAPHLLNRRFVAIVDGFPGNYIVVQAEETRFLREILIANQEGLGTGVTLGYQPEDIVRCMLAEDRQSAKRGPITDDEHAEVVKRVMANPRPDRAIADAALADQPPPS